MDRPAPASLDVVIAEDSPTQAKRLTRLLEQHGCKVRHGINGRAALEEVQQQVPDLIISDVVMPEVTGFDLCRAVRSDYRCDDVPIILLTTLSAPEYVMEGLAAGASNYLMKPYTEDALLQRIEQTLEGAGAADGPADTVEVRFRDETYRVGAGGAQIAAFLLSSFDDAVRRNTELQTTNRQLREALATITRLEARYHNLLESSAEAMLVVAPDGSILFANSPAFALFGAAHGELEGSRFEFPLEVGVVREVSLTNRFGEKVHAELRVVKTHWGHEDAFLASLWDMTENVRLREELRDLSLTDELTGLYNRRGFLTLVEQQMKVARRTGEELQLLFMDMDGMKFINDHFGHAAGDDALVETAGLLRHVLRDSDIIARMGGDEFAVLLIDANASGPEPERRLRKALDKRNRDTSERYEISLSLGVVSVPSDSRVRLADLLSEADRRMYADKEERKRTRD